MLVRAQSQKPEAQIVQHTLKDIPKATRCELQDPISQHPVLRAAVCTGPGSRHHYEPPHSASVSLHSSLRRKGGEEEEESKESRKPYEVFREWGTGGQAKFWSLLDVRCCYTYSGDCHECLGQAERELVAPGDISRAGPLDLCGLSPLGSRTTSFFFVL